MLQIPANLKEQFLEHATVSSKQSILQIVSKRLGRFRDENQLVVMGFRYKNEYCEVTGTVAEIKTDYVVIVDKWDYLAVDLKGILFVDCLENIARLDGIGT